MIYLKETNINLLRSCGKEGAATILSGDKLKALYRLIQIKGDNKLNGIKAMLFAKGEYIAIMAIHSFRALSISFT